MIFLLRLKANVEYHVKVAIFGALADIVSNGAELLVRFAAGTPPNMTVHEAMLVILVGLLRSFFCRRPMQYAGDSSSSGIGGTEAEGIGAVNAH